MQKIEMDYDGDAPKKSEKSTEKAKLPFFAPIKITENMTDDSKKFFERYNIMQKELVSIGRMEPK